MANSIQRQTTSDGGGDRTERLSDKVERVADEASDAALARVDSMRTRAQGGLERSREEVAHRIRRVGGALRSANEELRREDEDLAGYGESALDGIDRVAGYVDRATVKSVVADLTQVARSQPIPFFGGAFLLGFSAGRLLKNAVDAAATPKGPSGRSESRAGEAAPRAPIPTPRRHERAGGDAGFEEIYPVREPSSP